MKGEACSETLVTVSRMCGRTEYIENNQVAFFSPSVLVASFIYAKTGPSPFSFRIFSISLRSDLYKESIL